MRRVRFLSFFLIEDNGITSLTHHLPVGSADDCFLGSALGGDCRVVEAISTSISVNNQAI